MRAAITDICEHMFGNKKLLAIGFTNRSPLVEQVCQESLGNT
jgi:hypothetical protein